MFRILIEFFFIDIVRIVGAGFIHKCGKELHINTGFKIPFGTISFSRSNSIFCLLHFLVLYTVSSFKKIGGERGRKEREGKRERG